jgi:hypothetical protein
MDKAQALNQFWNSFGLRAYEVSTVPEYIFENGEKVKVEMPYITYDVMTDNIERVVNLSASLWYRSTSWRDITLKAKEIEKRLAEHGGEVVKLDNGYMYIYPGTPFTQHGTDLDDSIRRININVQVEFLTAY